MKMSSTLTGRTEASECILVKGIKCGIMQFSAQSNPDQEIQKPQWQKQNESILERRTNSEFNKFVIYILALLMPVTFSSLKAPPAHPKRVWTDQRRKLLILCFWNSGNFNLQLSAFYFVVKILISVFDKFLFYVHKICDIKPSSLMEIGKIW